MFFTRHDQLCFLHKPSPQELLLHVLQAITDCYFLACVGLPAQKFFPPSSYMWEKKSVEEVFSVLPM